MEKYHRQYTKKDVDQAFNMGLSSAIYVLEKSKELSPDGLQYMVKSLKKLLGEGDEEYQSQ